jgi:hypothetical protein
MLANRGQVFTELLKHLGPAGWPVSEAMALRNATSNGSSLDEAWREEIAELLWHGFNRMFPPETAQAGEEWARVQWYEPNCAPQYIEAQSAVSLFTVVFRFYPGEVNVSYAGPVRFSLAVVQLAECRVFARSEAFRTEDGDWSTPDASFWPADEAGVLAGTLLAWQAFVVVAPPHILAAVEDSMWHGFNWLLRQLRAAGEERRNHAGRTLG